jgi:hypothetical protein
MSIGESESMMQAQATTKRKATTTGSRLAATTDMEINGEL